MPGIAGEATDFKNKWNAELRKTALRPGADGDLDGEYVDSSEGYVTDELDFRRDHFAAAEHAAYVLAGHPPAGHLPRTDRLRVRPRDRRDVHAMDKLMMANSTPIRLCWLAPLLDVMGTETELASGRHVAPDVRRRSALSPGDVQGQAVLLPDEHAFRGVLARAGRAVHEAGAWPTACFPASSATTPRRATTSPGPSSTTATGRCSRSTCPCAGAWPRPAGSRSRWHAASDEHVYVERFGDRYLTVFNDSLDRPERCSIRTELPIRGSSRELLGSRPIIWDDGKTTLTLDPESVAVIDLRPDHP